MKMQKLSMMSILGIIVFWGHLSYGVQGENGLVFGVSNSAAIVTSTEFPKAYAETSNYSNLTVMDHDQVTSLASDEIKRNAFVVIDDVIYMYPNLTIPQKSSVYFPPLYKGKSSAAFGQIAFDFVTSNLYWCDSLFHWIVMIPAYISNNTIYKIVVQENLHNPEGLTLDPGDRSLFFSDNGPKPRIEKASLDGQNREVIVYRGLLRVRSLTVDTDKNKLYWADFDKYTLEGCDYDGSNRRVIRRMDSISMTGIAYYQNMLYAVSPENRTMYSVDIMADSVVHMSIFPYGTPAAISVYIPKTSGSSDDPCPTLRCHHMCLYTRSEPHCICSEGSNLHQDGRTCEDTPLYVEKTVIVSNTSVLAFHKLQSANGPATPFFFKLGPSTKIETFAVNAKLKIIYFVDSGNNFLKSYAILSQQTKSLTSVSSAADLTFDWIANQLGWIEESGIRYFAVGSQTTDSLYSHLQQPSSLTVNPYNRALYWISGAKEKSIVCGSWSGDTPTVLISSANLENPHSLQYDVRSNRIFWLDRSSIKSSTINGFDIKSHFKTFGAVKAFVYKDFFGWIKDDKLFFRKESETVAEALFTVQNSKDVVVIDSTQQNDWRDTCNVLNGGCSDICVPEKKSYRCECDNGFQLLPDNKTCSIDVLTTNFLLVTDYTHGKIFQISIENETIVQLPLHIKKVIGLAISQSTKMLYYSENSTKTITSTTLQGKNSTLLFASDFANAESLAIDYATGNLYFTALAYIKDKSYIGVVHRSTLHHKTLINKLNSPKDISIFTSKGFLFWTELGKITKIGRANMDGTSKTYILRDVGWPNGLTIDYTVSRLYWTDGIGNRIESSDLNGRSRQILATDSDAHLMDIVSYGQYLFYTAWNRQGISKIDKKTGSKVSFMSHHPEFGRLDSLDIFADIIQNDSGCSNNNGLCSTFCFSTPSGKTCGCQDNVDLQPDGLTCQGVLRCPTFAQNLILLECPPYPGWSCDFECKVGYRRKSKTLVTCESTGKWSPPTESLCEEIKCPLQISNGDLSSSCLGFLGEKCEFVCKYDPTMKPVNLKCLPEGLWDKDTKAICSFKDKCEISMTCLTAGLIGISVFIAIIGISGISVYLWLKIGITNLQIGRRNVVIYN